MIKSVILIRRRADVEPADFRRIWLEEHAPLVARSLPGLAMYRLGLPIESGAPTPSERAGASSGAAYDGLVELGFNSIESMQRAYASPTWTDPERIRSSERILDFSRVLTMTVEEHPIK